MRSMALLSCGGGGDVARRERLAQRQEIEQQLDQRAGIAADVAAVGQDLPIELARRSCLIALRRCRACPAMHSAA